MAIGCNRSWPLVSMRMIAFVHVCKAGGCHRPSCMKCLRSKQRCLLKPAEQAVGGSSMCSSPRQRIAGSVPQRTTKEATAAHSWVLDRSPLLERRRCSFQRLERGLGVLDGISITCVTEVRTMVPEVRQCCLLSRSGNANSSPEFES
jgi:hypothetical protein